MRIRIVSPAQKAALWLFRMRKRYREVTKIRREQQMEPSMLRYHKLKGTDGEANRQKPQSQLSQSASSLTRSLSMASQSASISQAELAKTLTLTVPCLGLKAGPSQVK